MPISLAIVDSGPLAAVANRADPDYDRCLAVLQDPTLRLVVPALCVAEVSFLLGKRKGPAVEAAFLRGLEGFAVMAPSRDEWSRIAELVEQYRDFPLGGTDASVVALAERLGTDRIVTLDRRHFGVVRDRAGHTFHLLPD